jgi:prepilin-type N-terminal cleavage/methylation domain-containing protein
MRDRNFLACRLQHRQLRAFSLVELLMVMVIISILIGLAYLAIPSLLVATGFNQGSHLVIDSLDFARQNAITQNVPTVAVVRITGPNAWQRLAVFSAPVSNSGSSQWAQVSPWRNLPAQTFIDSTYDPSTEPWTTLANSIAQSSVLAPATAIQDMSTPLIFKQDYYAIGFLPDGSLQNTANVALRIVKGRLTNGAIVVEQDSGGQPLDWVKLIILQITGQVKDIRKGQ